jgi:hypothetical protein
MAMCSENGIWDVEQPLTEADAKERGWPSLQAWADHVTARLGTDDATTKKAMETAPGAWRRHPELKRQ